MQLNQAYRRIKAYRQGGIALYTFAITSPLAILLIVSATQLTHVPWSGAAVFFWQVSLLAAISAALAWSSSSALQARASAGLPKLVQPVVIKLLGPASASQTGRLWAAVIGLNRKQAAYTAAAGLLGTLYVSATLCSLTSGSRQGDILLLSHAQIWPGLRKNDLTMSVAGAWLYGLSTGLASALLTTMR